MIGSVSNVNKRKKANQAFNSDLGDATAPLGQLMRRYVYL